MIKKAAAVLLVCVFVFTPAAAQQSWPVSVELSLGASFGTTSGIYRTGGFGLFADATIAAQLAPGNTGGFVVAINASAQGLPAYEDNCILRPDYVGCVPYFPAFATLAATAGLENARGRFRFLAGPARLSEDGHAALGILGRVDGSLPLLSHTSLTASLRGVFVPSFRGDDFALGIASFGIRLR